MKRLLEEDAVDSVRVRGTALLRSGGAPSPSSDVKRRVRAALEAAPATGAGRRGSAARAAVLAVLVICSSATAGATIGRGWVSRVLGRLAAGPAEEAAPARQPVTSPARLSRASTARRAPAAPSVVAAPVTTPVIPMMPAPVVRPSLRADTRASAREASDVMQAMVALRKHGDPAGAAVRLERYLHDYPRGALREEALALSIEAASASDDHAARARWARAYLRGFPSGRFQRLARESLER